MIVVYWPASSPDMNGIEHVWDDVDRIFEGPLEASQHSEGPFQSN